MSIDGEALGTAIHSALELQPEFLDVPWIVIGDAIAEAVNPELGDHADLYVPITGKSLTADGAVLTGSGVENSIKLFVNTTGSTNYPTQLGTSWHFDSTTTLDSPFSLWKKRVTDLHLFAQSYDSGGVAQGWKELWHSGNDGVGSELDADKLDGLHASSFLRKDLDDTMAGNLTMAAEKVFKRNAHHTGHFEGGFDNIGNNSFKSNPVYTMGSSYNPNETDLNNMYGIGYSRAVASFLSDANTAGLTGYGLYVAADGDARIFLDASAGKIWASGRIYCDKLNIANLTGSASGSLLRINGGIVYFDSSSEKLKTNVENLEIDIDKFKLLRPVEFNEIAFPHQDKTVGLIAEEVVEIYPKDVGLSKFGRPQSVDYSKIYMRMVSVVQDLLKRVDKLEGV